MARISVIIPTYQHGMTIVSCLKSVFEQTLPPFEVIVVNDGSTDLTLTNIEPFLGKIRLINQKHQGANVARNRGFQESTGEFLLFCDADVLMKPQMLERLLGALQANPQASYAYSGFRFGWKKFPSRPFSARRLHHRNYIHTSALIRREHFPGFDPQLKRFQDWDVWLTMLKTGHHGVFVNDILFKVQTHNTHLGISKWRPSLFYFIPWKWLGFMPRSVRYYEEARSMVLKKHRRHL